MVISEVPRKKKQLELNFSKVNFTVEDISKLSLYFFLWNIFFFLGSNYM